MAETGETIYEGSDASTSENPVAAIYDATLYIAGGAVGQFSVPHILYTRVDTPAIKTRARGFEYFNELRRLMELRAAL